MIRPKRRNNIWLAALGGLVGLVLISGSAPVTVQIVLAAIFAAAVVASFIDLRAPRSLIRAIQQRSPLSRTRISPQAQEAAARAQSRGSYLYGHLTLLDVGLIAAQTGSDGMVMRRTRSVSKDDDGVRPFLVLQVAPDEADRNCLIRFEIIDQNGREQYVHEMKIYLRDGEMNILADHHLPLMKNPQVEGMGDWDLRLYIDGALAGVHSFQLTPSYEDRRRRLDRGEGRYYITQAEPEQDSSEEIPLSLEDLLRNQGRADRR